MKRLITLSLLLSTLTISCGGRKDTMNEFLTPSVPAQKLRAEAGNESYHAIEENRFIEVADAPLSTFSIDVDAASYSNVRRFLNDNQLPPVDAVRIEELINYFAYDYPTPQGRDPFSITTEVSECPWNGDHRLLHIGLRAREIPFDELPPNNLVFLIDVSGSMNNSQKLPLLKAAFTMMVNQLRPEDRVAIVVYAGSAGLVLPSTSGGKRERIEDALNKLRAGGSTAGGAGIKLAYQTARENFIEDGNNRVILATDGDFNVGISDDKELVRLIERERKTGVFLSVLGFGTGNLKDSRMEQIADHGNGHYAYIDNLLEAKKVLVRELGATLATVAKDVKLQIEFNPAKVDSYRLIGYENRLLADRDFNDDRKDAGDMGAGHTVTALYELVPTGSVGRHGEVDPLKYQPSKRTGVEPQPNEELLTIKCRYKEPDLNVSRRLEQAVIDDHLPLDQTSDDFRFAAAVAEFGMLLRESEYRVDASWSEVMSLAEETTGRDKAGYRKEFLRLVESAQLLSGELASDR